MIAEPAACVSGAGGEDVVQRIKANRDAGGAGQAVAWREHARGVQNQQGMGKIASAENADTHQQAAERRRQSFEAEQERAWRLWSSGTFANEKPEARDSDEPWQQCP